MYKKKLKRRGVVQTDLTVLCHLATSSIRSCLVFVTLVTIHTRSPLLLHKTYIYNIFILIHQLVFLSIFYCLATMQTKDSFVTEMIKYIFCRVHVVAMEIELLILVLVHCIVSCLGFQKSGIYIDYLFFIEITLYDSTASVV